MATILLRCAKSGEDSQTENADFGPKATGISKEKRSKRGHLVPFQSVPEHDQSRQQIPLQLLKDDVTEWRWREPRHQVRLVGPTPGRPAHSEVIKVANQGPPPLPVFGSPAPLPGEYRQRGCQKTKGVSPV